MVKKKKAIHKKETSVKKHTIPAPFFMGLTKPQTQSLAVGIIAAGLFLFGLATFSWKNAEKQQMAAVATPMITPTDSGTISLTPTLTQMISATSTARLNPKQPLIKELPNTTSKVTYTAFFTTWFQTASNTANPASNR